MLLLLLLQFVHCRTMISTRSAQPNARGTKRKNGAQQTTAIDRRRMSCQDRYVSRLPTAGAAGADNTGGGENRTPSRNSPVGGTHDGGGPKEVSDGTPMAVHYAKS